MKKTGRIICALLLAVLGFFFCTIILRTFTRQVLVKRFGINNAFTDFVLFDLESLNDGTNSGEDGAEEEPSSSGEIKVNWQALYPFTEDLLKTDKEEEKAGLFDTFAAKASSLKGNVETYTSDYLIGYKKITELAKGYEKAIKWNYAAYSEYNGVITTSDGYLTGLNALTDNTLIAEATASLADFCAGHNSLFLFVNAPFKVCEYDDADIAGVTDFTNQNATSFIEKLEALKVDCCDLRKLLHEDGLNHHELFFKTDHHWKPEAGLWAARSISKALNLRYGFDLDTSLLEDDKFTSVVYPEWFLGSQGKKVTLSGAEPEDISLVYPNYATEFYYEVKARGIASDGDFSVMYDMNQISERDYYNKSPYYAYAYGDQALERIENKLLNNGKRILFIHDSFGDCVIPFLALGCQYVDAIDLRHFDGSLCTFIMEEKPDAVVLMYNASMTRYEYADEAGPFDFR